MAGGSSQDTGASMSVLGKSTRTVEETTDTATAVGGDTEERPRNEALEIALAAILEGVRGHAQWWNSELKPQVEAHNSPVMEGGDGAVSAWVADEGYRA